MPQSRFTRSSRPSAWLPAAGFAALLVGAAPLAAREDPPEPIEETVAFEIAGAAGTLTLPAGAPDMLSPAIIIIQDGTSPDGRASRYTDQLLGAGFVVLEMAHLPDGALDAVLAALARHPRVAGQPLGVLGFGAGARIAASLRGPVAARALLYPGCACLPVTVMPGQAVLLMHGSADPANEVRQCESLGIALGETGARVRLRVLPGASYAWDYPAYGLSNHAMLPDPHGGGRVRAEAWPELAEISATETASFFVASFRGPRR